MKTHHQRRKAKAFPSKLATAKEWATCVLAKIQRQAGWGRFTVEEGKASGCPDGRLWAWGSCRWLMTRGCPMRLARGTYVAFSGWSSTGRGDKN